MQLACARTIHRTQGLTLEKMAFDPSGISQHGLIYTTLSRVRNINALYILQRLTTKNFNVNKKISDEMTRLETFASWKLDLEQRAICNANVNVLSIGTLNTRNAVVHIDDIAHDTQLMNNMIICLQETHLSTRPNKNEFVKFNIIVSYLNYGLLTCIRDDIQINATRNYNNSKVELSVVDMYFKKSICLMNIYAAPFEQVQRITETIQKAESESMNSNSIIIIAGDFNVDMQLNSARRKHLTQFMESQQLYQITTRFSPTTTIIDHIWTNHPILQCEVNVSDAYWSDHDIIYALLQF